MTTPAHDQSAVGPDAVSARGRFVVVNAYSNRNAGDAAIVLATDRVLDDLGFGRLVNATRYWREDAAFYAPRGIDVVGPVVPFPVRQSKSGPRRAAEFAAGTAVAYGLALSLRHSPGRLASAARTARLPGLAAIAEADGVALCGGGYLYSGRRAINLTLLHNAITTHLATLVNARVVMIPQSVGPLRTRGARRIVGSVLRRLGSIVVREHSSLTELEAVDPRLLARAEVCPDIALYGWAGAGEATDAAPPARLRTSRAVLVAMDWTWARAGAGSPELDRYVEHLASVASSLAGDGVEVIVTGHSALPEQDQDDMKIAARVVAAAVRNGARNVSANPLGGTPESLHHAFSEADVVVGTRLHACLIALGAGTPAIGLAYQPKTTGTYELLGLSDLSRDVATFEASDVAALALSCIGDLDRRERLAKTVGDARSRIVATIGRLAETS